jgi:hypothetical protein
VRRQQAIPLGHRIAAGHFEPFRLQRCDYDYRDRFVVLNQQNTHAIPNIFSPNPCGN